MSFGHRMNGEEPIQGKMVQTEKAYLISKELIEVPLERIDSEDVIRNS